VRYEEIVRITDYMVVVVAVTVTVVSVDRWNHEMCTINQELRSSHLGSYRPLTLQLQLVSFECLLAAVFQVGACMMFRKLNYKIEPYNVGIPQLSARLRTCTAYWGCQLRIDNHNV